MQWSRGCGSPPATLSAYKYSNQEGNHSCPLVWQQGFLHPQRVVTHFSSATAQRMRALYPRPFSCFITCTTHNLRKRRRRLYECGSLRERLRSPVLPVRIFVRSRRSTSHPRDGSLAPLLPHPNCQGTKLKNKASQEQGSRMYFVSLVRNA